MIEKLIKIYFKDFEVIVESENLVIIKNDKDSYSIWDFLVKELLPILIKKSSYIKGIYSKSSIDSIIVNLLDINDWDMRTVWLINKFNITLK